MLNKFYLIDLYDIYGSLLTEKQKNYFEDYYFDNLTLKEISENNSVSRNAVHNSLKETEEKLINYEKNLKIYIKNKKIEQIIKEEKDQRIKKELKKIIEE